MMESLIVNYRFLLRIIISMTMLLSLYLAKRIILYRINKTGLDVTVKHNYRRIAVCILSAIAFLILGTIWIRRINFGIIFSIIGAGLVISLSDLILSSFGWFFIIVRKPFEIGERVQIGSVKGDVVDIRGFSTVLLEIEGWVKDEQSTGRIVYIPNNFIFRQPVYNYTKGFDFIWDEIKIAITFESNYKKAEEVCLKYLNEFHDSWAKDLDKKIRQAQNIYAIYYEKLTPTVYVKIIDSGILLSLRYLVEPHRRRYSEDLLYKKILDEFSKAKDITFAYTTYRIIK